MILFILAWISLHLILLVASYKRIKRSKRKISFIYTWGAVFGAFVWEDLVIFSAFNLIVGLVVLALKDVRFGILLVAIFWIVRSTGEALYFMLQQFLQPKHSPHSIDAHFIPLRKIFGNISEQQCFIIMQVGHQINVVFFIFVVITTLMNWGKIPTWI